MTKQEFATLVVAMQVMYGEDFIGTEQALDVWYALLHDLDYQILSKVVLCWMIYGLKGFENISWMVLSQHMLQPVLFLKYLGILLGLAFQALLSLCAIALCVSAYQNSSFGAVIIAAVCWGLPVLIRMFFGGIIWLIVDSMPIFLVMTGIVNDIYEIWYIVLGINICFAIGCLVKGLVSYKTKQFA